MAQLNPQKLKLAVLISGRGTNLQALIEACKDPDFPAKIALVISNNPQAAGLDRAAQAGLSTAVVDHKDFADKRAFESALLEALEKHGVNLVCLAGFMRVLSPYFIAHWNGRLINIHPSLLPDYKGLHTHERVLQDGRHESGCTVHHVTAEVDSGAIIVQKRVKVLPNDTPDTLAARVLEQEHLAYPEAVRIVAKTLVGS